MKAIKDGFEIQPQKYVTELRHSNPVIEVTIDKVSLMTPSPLFAGIARYFSAGTSRIRTLRIQRQTFKLFGSARLHNLY